MTGLPASPSAFARPVSKTAAPDAAPGEAAIPRTAGRDDSFAFSSSAGCSSWSSFSIFRRRRPCSLDITPSRTMSTDMRTMAAALVFAARVCSR